jgi:hypothetical protein
MGLHQGQEFSMSRLLLATVAALTIVGQANAALIVYEGNLIVDGPPGLGSVIGDSLDDPTLYDYWSFDALAGDTITLKADRLDAEADLIMSLFFGAATDTDQFINFFTSFDLEFVEFADDVNPSPLGGPFLDPEFTVTLTQSGTYTVLVAEHPSDDSPPGPYPYTITLTSAAPVPEPTTFAMFGLGGLGLAFGALRRRFGRAA